MRSLRFRMRTLLTIVPAAGLVLGLGLRTLVGRSIHAERLRMEDQHVDALTELQGSQYNPTASCWFSRYQPIHTLDDPDWAAAKEGRRAAYHFQLAEKWRLAAQEPWRPVALDPPPPE